MLARPAPPVDVQVCGPAAETASELSRDVKTPLLCHKSAKASTEGVVLAIQGCCQKQEPVSSVQRTVVNDLQVGCHTGNRRDKGPVD